MRRICIASMSLLSVIVIAGCHKTTTGGDDDTTNPDAPSLTGEKYTITWGPLTIPAGQEDTQCIWVKVPNTEAIKVHEMHNVLGTTSHHLIVYKDDHDTTEQLTPVPCQPFTGALNTTGMIAPLAITQKKDDLITLPDGVAYYLGVGQMIKLEMHYINSTDTDQVATASVDLYAADPVTIHDEASILFAGSPDIQIPANSTFELHAFLTMPATLDMSASHIFAITGHEHHLGTNVQVSVAPAKTGPMTPVYTPSPFQWAEPLTQVQTPDFSVPKGGGFDFTCDWNNTTASPVKFGESATNEMCFFWAYYWPSQGARVCFHTTQAGGHDICCPGDGLCSLIANQF
jgi:hypothetical protein